MCERKIQDELPRLTDQSGKIVVLHADTKEKIETNFVGGLREFLTIVDKKSMFLKAVPLRSKADTSGELQKFVRYFKHQTDHLVNVLHRMLHTDGGPERSRAIA